MTFREISYWRPLLAGSLENSDMVIIEVSGHFHENRSRFNIFHDKSLSSLDGNTGQSEAPESFLFADYSCLVTSSLCTFVCLSETEVGTEAGRMHSGTSYL